MQIANWGNFPTIEAEVNDFSFEDEARHQINKLDCLIPRGLGSSYGDASLQADVLSSLHYQRFIAFDQQNGILTCEAGLSLVEIIQQLVPKGWFLPVSPGTKYVTIGGAIASDIHGKNHHKEGTFGDHVQNIKLLLADGSLVNCGPEQNQQLFQATCGGMGLTGLILEATFQLKSVETPFIKTTTYKANNLDQIFKLFDETKDYNYSVAWLDCLAKGHQFGRSILSVGEHATQDEVGPPSRTQSPIEAKSINMPFYLPALVLNDLSIRAFNFLYYHRAAHNQSTFTSLDPFFYPLDKIKHWNRMYGKRGFVQYQFVLPLKESYEGIPVILEKIVKKGLASFLTVLKLLGPQEGMLSFPKEGYTLALDFPVNDEVLAFLKELDKLVLKYDGRIYLAKDARMPESVFSASYPELNRFKEIKSHYDPQGKFTSTLSERLGL